MSQYYLFGTLLLSFILLIGCSSEALPVESQDHNEKLNEFSIVKDSLPGKESIEKEAEEEKVTGINNDSLSTSQNDDSILLEEMELLKEKLRKYIFDDYMGSSDYVYAKGINWSLNFYDNLSAEEIWDVIEEYKDINNEEGTLFEQAQYLSINAPIKDNWEELFLENWNSSPYADDHEIETMIDKGDSVWIFTDTLPYTGEEDNYPFITLYKNTGNWHG